nr:reverse transcriptase domain-containing protein [Tanacetum cinerariifolium]
MFSLVGSGRTRGHFGGQGNGRDDGLGGQVGGQGSEINGGVNGVPEFSTIIAQKLQNLLPTIVAQVGDQGRGQGNGRNQNSDAVSDNIRGDIMPLRMRTRSAGRPAAESLGGGMGVRVGRGRRGRRPKKGNDEHVDDLNDQGNDQGMGDNKGVEGVNGNVEGANGGAPDFSIIIAQQLQNILPAMLAHVEFCPSNEMQKLESELWNHVMVRAGHAAYTARNESIKKVEKRGNMGEPSIDKSGRDDNKRTRIENVFATTINPVERENTGVWPKCNTCNSYDAPGGPCRICFNYNRLGHLTKDCRGVPRNVNPVNDRNPPVRACYELKEFVDVDISEYLYLSTMSKKPNKIQYLLFKR